MLKNRLFHNLESFAIEIRLYFARSYDSTSNLNYVFFHPSLRAAVAVGFFQLQAFALQYLTLVR